MIGHLLIASTRFCPPPDMFQLCILNLRVAILRIERLRAPFMQSFWQWTPCLKTSHAHGQNRPLATD
jgi:hypothetical protein